jgi:hypothetical protein
MGRELTAKHGTHPLPIQSNSGVWKYLKSHHLETDGFWKDQAEMMYLNKNVEQQ